MKRSFKEHYYTSDLSLACTISLFLPIWVVDKSNPKKVEFVFEKSEKLLTVVNSFWQRKLQVEPLAYFQQLKYLKSRIREE